MYGSESKFISQNQANKCSHNKVTHVRQKTSQGWLHVLLLWAKNNEKNCKAITSGNNRVTLELPQQQ